jgi:hypothetical protein
VTRQANLAHASRIRPAPERHLDTVRVLHGEFGTSLPAVDAQLQLADAAAGRRRDAHQYEPGVRCIVGCVPAGDIAGADAQVAAVVVPGARRGGEIVRSRPSARW